MPFPTSLWTGKVTATVAINGQGVVSCTFEGDLVLEISLGPPLQGENLPGADAYPAMTNRIEGGLQGTFNGTATPGAERSQGSGIVAYYIVGIYDPVTHTISINTTTTGTKATGTYVSPSNSSAIAISEGMIGSSGPVFLPGVATDSSIVSLGETSTDPDNLLSNCLPNAPNASQPIVLDLQKSGVQTIVQTDQNWMGSVATTWNFTLDAHQIEVEIDPSELDPTANNPSATLTVTSNRQPGKSETVSLQLCTYIGGMLNDATHAPDGHLHDQRTDMCDHSSRPAGQLVDTNGQAGPAGKTYGAKDYPLMATTDLNGKIALTYQPPPDGFSSTPHILYISGKDQITASMVTAPNTKAQADIITQVPDLQAMPGSSDGSGGGTYYFTPQHGQTGHGYLFYGTASTNQTLVQIANAF